MTFASRRRVLPMLFLLVVLSVISSCDAFDSGGCGSRIFVSRCRHQTPRGNKPSLSMSSIEGDDIANDNNNNTNNVLLLIQSWLKNHLPTLPPNDVTLYTKQLLRDGFTSLDRLNAINTDKSHSGRLEDLYFMKKGHRSILMKKLGIDRKSSPNKSYVQMCREKLEAIFSRENMERLEYIFSMDIEDTEDDTFQ